MRVLSVLLFFSLTACASKVPERQFYEIVEQRTIAVYYPDNGELSLKPGATMEQVNKVIMRDALELGAKAQYFESKLNEKNAPKPKKEEKAKEKKDSSKPTNAPTKEVQTEKK